MFWSNPGIYGQTLNNALMAQDTIAVSNPEVGFLKENPKDGISAVKALFHIYKHYIASQDAQHCRYSPSCSEYAFLSINKHGMVFGMIDFFDRFTRCNPLSPENYEYDEDKNIFRDPVQ